MQNKFIVAAAAAVMLIVPAFYEAAEPSADYADGRDHGKAFQLHTQRSYLKVNEPAVLVFKSEDATHGMHFDDLDINAVISKDKGAEVKFTPDKVGDFVGHCAVFCGNGHGNMMLTIHVVQWARCSSRNTLKYFGIQRRPHKDGASFCTNIQNARATTYN